MARGRAKGSAGERADGREGERARGRAGERAGRREGWRARGLAGERAGWRAGGGRARILLVFGTAVSSIKYMTYAHLHSSSRISVT